MKKHPEHSEHSGIVVIVDTPKDKRAEELARFAVELGQANSTISRLREHLNYYTQLAKSNSGLAYARSVEITELNAKNAQLEAAKTNPSTTSLEQLKQDIILSIQELDTRSNDPLDTYHQANLWKRNYFFVQLKHILGEDKEDHKLEALLKTDENTILKEEAAQLRLDLSEERRRNRELQDENRDLKDTNKQLVKRIRSLDALIPGLMRLLHPSNRYREVTIGSHIGHVLSRLTDVDLRKRQN